MGQTWLRQVDSLGQLVGHAGEKKRPSQAGLAEDWAQDCFENAKGFSISYFDSNSNFDRVSTQTLKLKHSINSK
jgi:hypothetical protein